MAREDASGFDRAATTIGLCMIVKDEAAVIERCLDSVRPLIDYVLIEDTGSSDGTQGIIRAYLRRHGIPGEVIEEKWRDFAYNRSHVLARLRENTSIDYALMMDADDRLITEPGFDAAAFKAGLHADLYHLHIRLGSTRYHRPQICSNRREFHFRGVVHEFLAGPPSGFSSDSAERLYIAAGVEGARSNDPDKYRKDALAIERALAAEKDPFLRTRYTFYLAQSWRDCGEKAKSVAAYLERAGQGGWGEEVYVSLYNAGKLQEALGEPIETVMATLQRAINLIPNRAEAYYAAARACRLAGRHQRGYEIAKCGIDLPEPATGLFVEAWIYQYGLLDELAICAYWSGHYAESLAAGERLLRDGTVPPDMVDRITRNRDFAQDRLDEAPLPVPQTGSAAATGLPAVFIHSSWRTSSTWFLAKFRACPDAMAFFEPFNPLLATATADQLQAWNFTYWDSHHPADDPYCLEYLPLLRRTGGVRRFCSEMEYEWYIPEGGLCGELRPQEQSYLAQLVQHARTAGRVPVLGCTRSLGRLGAIKRAFGGRHIFLYRNLWHQWQSFLRYRRQNVPFFYETTAAILDKNKADPFLKYIAGFYLAKTRDGAAGGGNLHRLLTLPEADGFAMFAALQIYLYLYAESVADLTVDVTRMSRDVTYRQSIERELAAKTGLSVSLADVAAGENPKPRDIAVDAVRWDEIAGHAARAADFLDDLTPHRGLRERATRFLADTRAAAERYAAFAHPENGRTVMEEPALTIEPTRDYLGFPCGKCGERFSIVGPLDPVEHPPDKPMRIGARGPLPADCPHCGHRADYAIQQLIRFSK